MPENSLCHACIGDKVLSAEVRTTGTRATCCVCDHRRQCWPMSQIAQRIHGVLQTNYNIVPASPYDNYGYGFQGDDPGFTITELAQLDDEAIGREIQTILSDRYGPSARYHDMEDDPYGDDVSYVFADPDTSNLRLSWSSFCNQLKKHSRFFNAPAKDILDDLFGDISRLSAGRNQPVIRTYPARRSGTQFYRGRVATTEAALEKIIADPVREMSAPPHSLARVGRMNGAGISLFYGALDVETCLAEIRAPVGSNVVVTAFRNVRALRLLDLARLRSISVGGSMFAADFRERYEFATFLEHLVKELSRPIMPGAEEMDYLPTQAFAEYLANREDLKLDGMLFPSSQLEGGELNVVLFHAASRTKGKCIPEGSKTSMLGPQNDEDGEPDGVVVWVHPPPPKRRPKSKSDSPFGEVAFQDLPRTDEEVDEDWRPDTLHWVPDSLEVYRIKGVSYAKDLYRVSRYVEPKRKRTRFRKLR